MELEMGTMIIYLLAVTIGVLVTLTPIMNGNNTTHLGTIRVSFYHFSAAALTGLLFVLITHSSTYFPVLPKLPPHYFMGGLIGLMVMLLMNYYAIKIKAIHVAILPFLGQMSMGLLLDYFLLGIFDYKRLIGLIIVLLGLWIQAPKPQTV